MPNHPIVRRALGTVLAAGLALGVAACGDDADNAADPTTSSAPSSASSAESSSSSSTESSSSSSSPSAPAGKVVAVTAEDYRFVGLDAPVPAGSRLTLTNTSAFEVHELVAFRLPDDEKRSPGELVALGEDGLNAVVRGAPRAVLVAPPASEGFAALGDGTLTEPGRYLIICSIPEGADPAAYLAAAQASTGGPVSVPGGPPHIVKGMYADLDVTG